MWQEAAVGIIVVAAAGYLVWRLRRHFQGRASTCGCAQCGPPPPEPSCRSCERADEDSRG